MEFDVQKLKRTTLNKVSDDKAFVVVRGDRITNIYDLANCIEHLSPQQFTHHVNTKKNDFAAWIFHVLQNPLLSRDLDGIANINDQKHYVKTIRDHAAWLEHC